MLIVAQSMRDISSERLLDIYRGSLGESLTARQDFYAYLRRDFFSRPGVVLAVWEAEGCYVSALRLEPYREGLLLTGLETHPEHRGMGYAQKLLLAALPSGEKTYSHVAKDNEISLHIHQKAGFQIISDCAVYLDGSADGKSWTLCTM